MTDLEKLLGPKTFWVYSDGSANSNPLRLRTGAAGAMIVNPIDSTCEMVMTCCFPATNNRMELSAINLALVRLREMLSPNNNMNRAIIHETSVKLVADSEITIDGISGASKRDSNLDLWAQFDELSRGFQDVSTLLIPRNSEAPHAQTDALVHIFRMNFDWLLTHYLAKPELKQFAITKKDIIMPHENRRHSENEAATEGVQPQGGQGR